MYTKEEFIEDELKNRDEALHQMLEYPFLEATFLEVYHQLVLELTEPERKNACKDPISVFATRMHMRVEPFMQAGQFIRGFQLGYWVRVFRHRTEIPNGKKTRRRVYQVCSHFHLVPKGISPTKLTKLQMFSCELATKLGAISGEHGFEPGKQPWDS